MNQLQRIRSSSAELQIANELLMASLNSIKNRDLSIYLSSAIDESEFSEQLVRLERCLDRLNRSLVEFDIEVTDAVSFDSTHQDERFIRVLTQYREVYSQGEMRFETRGRREYLVRYIKAKDVIAGGQIVTSSSFSMVTTPEPHILPVIRRKIYEANFNEANIDEDVVGVDRLSEDWTWDGNACGKYSDKHALDRNTDYREYSNDCTNFASQCLKAGGKVYRDGDREDKKYWFYGLLQATTSYSWAGAQNLAAHLLDHTNSENPTNIGEMRIGDIVFYDRDTSGPYSMNHAMLVGDKVEGPDLLLNYHTNDTYRKSLQQIRAENPNLRWVFVKIGDTYT